jgi:hypothetical protein
VLSGECAYSAMRTQDELQGYDEERERVDVLIGAYSSEIE